MNKSENILRLSVYAGEIMLKNGAETYRIEDTMRHIIESYGYKISDCVVTATAISASIISEEDGIITVVKRVNERSTNLNKVALVNQFSRNLNSRKENFDKAYETLESIDKINGFSNTEKIFAAAFSCLGFSIMFGAKINDALASLCIGFLTYILFVLLSKNKVNSIISNLCIGLAIGTVAAFFEKIGLGSSKEIIIISSIMPYIPGLLLTNAVRDIFGGDYLSGSVRIIDAVMISVSLATGIGTALKIIMTFLGDL